MIGGGAEGWGRQDEGHAERVQGEQSLGVEAWLGGDFGPWWGVWVFLCPLVGPGAVPWDGGGPSVWRWARGAGAGARA